MTEPNTGTPSTSCNTSPNSAANDDRCFAHEFGYTSTGATGFCSAGACKGAVCHAFTSARAGGLTVKYLLQLPLVLSQVHLA